MQAHSFRPHELTLRQLDAWRALQASNPGLVSPYFSPEYTQLIGSVRQDVFVSAIVDGSGREVAFFPYQRDGSKHAIAVGGRISDYHGLIAAPGFNIDPDWLLAQSGLTSWAFDHLPADQKSFQSFYGAPDVSWVIDLSPGLEPYLKERRHLFSGHFKTLARRERKLVRELGPYRFEARVTDDAALEHLIQWKSAQYVASGIPDLFANGWARELMHKMQHKEGAKFAGQLSALYVDDKILAAHLGMRTRDVWHYWFPAYSIEFQNYSPGLILLQEMIRQACNDGTRFIDLGKGKAAYKTHFSNMTIDLVEGVAGCPTLRDRTTAKLKGIGSRVANKLRRNLSKGLKITLTGALL